MQSLSSTTLDEFAREYATPSSKAARAVEREVFGANVGVNGYTTIAQAARLVADLDLHARAHLLELGCGRGWPGLYLARKTACRGTHTDVPMDAVRECAAGITEYSLRGRCAVASADGRALPFPTRTFDAIVHSDVLC